MDTPADPSRRTHRKTIVLSLRALFLWPVGARAAIFANAGDYRIWPGPNSNPFVATVLRAIPETETILPANAVGRDFRSLPYIGLTDSRTGIEASLWGVIGIKVGWVEGVEMNFLGLVAGLDLRNPGVKLPGFGRIGLPQQTATAAPAR